MDQTPTKTDIEAVFHRLRAVPANKACFDCGAKNPTWSSVTYGVFICIDCSAVHRSLGVHLTFVRSTQLDTNWTWMQLRQMQLGGNSNALQFFTQHNCVTTDAQKKYNSRAAVLYRDKLQNLATSSLRTHKELNLGKDCFFSDNKLHITPAHVEAEEKEKVVDFFQEHENFHVPEEPVLPKIDSSQSLQNNTEGPKVDFVTNPEPLKKSTIGTRKTAPKKGVLGSKKGGLGATKVKTNFAELEREAEIAEEARLRALEESEKAAALSVKEQEEREAAIRLAYKDLSNEQLKKEEQLKKIDPKKAEQLERLGMGVGIREGISHSALSDMQDIEQENVQSTPSTLSSLGKLRISEDSFFDDFSSFGSGFNMNRTSNYKMDSAADTARSSDTWETYYDANSSFDDKEKSSTTTSFSSNSNKERSTGASYNREKSSKPKLDSMVGSSDEAQKKFGNAKAISSDQFFNDGQSDYETKANLNRFQGSSSISSSEFFGNGRDNVINNSNYAISNYDLDDVKESVRQGVTKVAGKLSSLANGVMSSLQDRYGY